MILAFSTSQSRNTFVFSEFVFYSVSEKSNIYCIQDEAMVIKIGSSWVKFISNLILSPLTFRDISDCKSMRLGRPQFVRSDYQFPIQFIIYKFPWFDKQLSGYFIFSNFSYMDDNTSRSVTQSWLRDRKMGSMLISNYIKCAIIHKFTY